MSFIAGAGSTNVDLLYTGMPRIPGVGEEVYSEGFEMQLGGGLPATLINLSRLGVEAKIATALGTDVFSEYAKGEYEKSGVSPLNLNEADKFPVNITSAIILKDDRSFVSYGSGSLGGNEAAREKFYNLASGSKITLMQPDSFLDVYRRLHNEGTLLVLDTGWDDALSVEKYRDYLEIADYYVPNRKEALKITATDNPEAALKVLSDYFERPVIKLDKEGVIGLENGKTVFVKSAQSFENVDSTGAGDAFLAGFCFGLFYGYPFKDCLLFGNITGGKCVTKPGALTAYVTKDELLSIAERQ